MANIPLVNLNTEYLYCLQNLKWDKGISLCSLLSNIVLKVSGQEDKEENYRQEKKQNYHIWENMIQCLRLQWLHQKTLRIDKYFQVSSMIQNWQKINNFSILQ